MLISHLTTAENTANKNVHNAAIEVTFAKTTKTAPEASSGQHFTITKTKKK